jgi:hypothetical protein
MFLTNELIVPGFSGGLSSRLRTFVGPAQQGFLDLGLVIWLLIQSRAAVMTLMEQLWDNGSGEVEDSAITGGGRSRRSCGVIYDRCSMCVSRGSASGRQTHSLRCPTAVVDNKPSSAACSEGRFQPEPSPTLLYTTSWKAWMTEANSWTSDCNNHLIFLD